ncbi:MAG: glycosyltransferase family 32 protein [Oscillospiraceae bacterium]
MEGIPKIIHYCWFGEGKIPNQYQKYIKTWEKTFPEYRICKWDEKNFPMEKYKYAMEALKSGKMAFVSDVARMYALYEYGGIYFDTDVEVIRDFSELLKDHGVVLGTESENKTIGTGFMAFVPHHEICKSMLEYYKTNSYYKQSATMSNTQILAHLLEEKYGIKALEKIQKKGDMIIYPSEYFTAHKGVTSKTRCIHHFGASWLLFRQESKG